MKDIVEQTKQRKYFFFNLYIQQPGKGDLFYNISSTTASDWKEMIKYVGRIQFT
jgi:hypothetical protein